jgi:hypothetical protein
VEPVDQDSRLPAWLIPAAIAIVLIGVAVSANNDSEDGRDAYYN